MNFNSPTNYDSEFCGSIPLNFINSIQPHGVILVLTKGDYQIAQISESILNFTGKNCEFFLGKDFRHFLSKQETEEVLARLSTGQENKTYFEITLVIEEREVLFSAIIHPKPMFLLLELEPVDKDTFSSFNRIYQQVKTVMSQISDSKNVLDLSNVAAREIKNISGFDKVMIYRFDKDWNGEVIGEAKEEDMDSYLFLRFPASDIPRQARELYFKNPYRLIPDIHYQPSRLIPVINPVINAFTDLSESNLRGVTNVHLEYLGNMIIIASMSVPIIIENKLWGLISCHHKIPNVLSHELRSAMELLAVSIGTKISSISYNEQLQLKDKLSNGINSIVEKFYTGKGFDTLFDEQVDEIKTVFELSGLSLVMNGNIKAYGKCPSVSQIKDIVIWLQLHKIDEVYTSENFPAIFAIAQEFKDTCSGILVIPLSSRKGDYILGYKPEIVETIKWGGNPNEAINFELDGKTYHPRNSFSIWKETVRFTSQPFYQAQKETAERLRTALMECIIRDKYEVS